MRVDNSTGKGTSGMASLAAKFTECTWSLEASFLTLRIKTQFLERLQSGSDVDGDIHTQKDDLEGNGGSLENVAEIFVLFLCGVQLVLRSGVLTILDLDEVNVTPMFAEVFRSVLSGVRWWLYWWLAVLLRCSQSPSSIFPCHSKKTTPLH